MITLHYQIMMEVFIMKKLVTILLILILMSIVQGVFAAEKITSEPLEERIKKIYAQHEKLQNPSSIDIMPKIAVMYINNSQTTYDSEIDLLILENLKKVINEDVYQITGGKPYIEKLNKIGISDITTAERVDIIDVFSGDDIDYAIFIQVDPFIRKDKITFFTIGKEMTATVPFKIIDVKNNKYIYNGKFTEISKDSSMIGDIGNKSVSMKSLEKVNEKILSVIEVRLPKIKNSDKLEK